MKILVTGGLGFIGSHTVVELLENNYDVCIVDNLYNSKVEVVDYIKKITGKNVSFYIFDVQNKNKLREVFEKEKPDGVIHFAGYKAVGESVAKPLEYYSNNLESTLVLLNIMKEFNCRNFVFSSSATIYGTPDHVPLSEKDPRKEATSPYGETKVMIERILEDVSKAWKEFNVAILRYFNPIGAHKSMLLGEDPNDIPNNLLPYINQVAVGKLECLKVFGNDYPTPDGTGIRDYIHVLDLARGHVLALNKLATNCGLVTYNLGTGKGTSVLEIVKIYEQATGVKIPLKIVERRPGDIAENYADCSKAERELNFKAKYSIYDACLDSYNYQLNHIK
ncbi:MAG: UDP-glucose 4-epimerase GalE [Candidatus Onthovivens sp.]|nr:UDP-glucose 4-epimerase GalE [Candidatus Onthovivens sp.]